MTNATIKRIKEFQFYMSGLGASPQSLLFKTQKIVASTQINGIDIFLFSFFDNSDIFNDMKQTIIQTEKLGNTETSASPTQQWHLP